MRMEIRFNFVLFVLLNKTYYINIKNYRKKKDYGKISCSRWIWQPKAKRTI